MLRRLGRVFKDRHDIALLASEGGLFSNAKHDASIDWLRLLCSSDVPPEPSLEEATHTL